MISCEFNSHWRQLNIPPTNEAVCPRGGGGALYPGGLCIQGDWAGPPLDTIGYGQRVGSTHPAGMHSCLKTPWYFYRPQTKSGKEWAVRILLECILVYKNIIQSSFCTKMSQMSDLCYVRKPRMNKRTRQWRVHRLGHHTKLYHNQLWQTTICFIHTNKWSYLVSRGPRWLFIWIKPQCTLAPGRCLFT